MQTSFSRRDLIRPERLRALMQRSNFWGVAQLGSHLGLICVTGTLLWLTWGSFLALPLFLVHGVLINFLYAGQHELSHGTPFKTRWPNEIFGRVIGFFMIFARDFDKIQHAAHHQWTQDWEKDGELVRAPFTLSSYLMWMSGITYWITRGTRMIRLSRGIVLEPYIRPDQHDTVIREARWHMLGYGAIIVASLVFQSWAAVMLWLAPMVVLKPVHQLQNTIEHLGLSHENDIFKNTRSTRTNGVLRWLCWQMPYHTAHHAFPSVPFWQLRHLDTELKGNGAEPYAMGWIEFQMEVIRKLSAKSEDQYPFDEVWVVPTARGPRRLEAA